MQIFCATFPKIPDFLCNIILCICMQIFCATLPKNPDLFLYWPSPLYSMIF